MNKKLFKDYIKLQQKLAELEDQKEILRAAIMGALKSDGVERAETDWGIFTRGRRRNYTYSDNVKKLEDKVKKLEDKVKVAKMKEVNSGVATSTETEYLRFTETPLKISL